MNLINLIIKSNQIIYIRIQINEIFIFPVVTDFFSCEPEYPPRVIVVTNPLRYWNLFKGLISPYIYFSIHMAHHVSCSNWFWQVEYMQPSGYTKWNSRGKKVSSLDKHFIHENCVDQIQEFVLDSQFIDNLSNIVFM